MVGEDQLQHLIRLPTCLPRLAARETISNYEKNPNWRTSNLRRTLKNCRATLIGQCQTRYSHLSLKHLKLTDGFICLQASPEDAWDVSILIYDNPWEDNSCHTSDPQQSRDQISLSTLDRPIQADLQTVEPIPGSISNQPAASSGKTIPSSSDIPPLLQLAQHKASTVAPWLRNQAASRTVHVPFYRLPVVARLLRQEVDDWPHGHAGLEEWDARSDPLHMTQQIVGGTARIISHAVDAACEQGRLIDVGPEARAQILITRERVD